MRCHEPHVAMLSARVPCQVFPYAFVFTPTHKTKTDSARYLLSHRCRSIYHFFCQSYEGRRTPRGSMSTRRTSISSGVLPAVARKEPPPTTTPQPPMGVGATRTPRHSYPVPASDGGGGSSAWARGGPANKGGKGDAPNSQGPVGGEGGNGVTRRRQRESRVDTPAAVAARAVAAYEWPTTQRNTPTSKRHSLQVCVGHDNDLTAVGRWR